MGFLSGLKDAFFGSKGGEMDWEGLMRMMEMDLQANRTNRHGAFSDWDWEEGPDGSWTQTQTLKPGMQQGADRLLARVGEGQGFDPYRSPEQFSTMLDSSMAAQMQRQGTLDPNYQVQQPGGMDQFTPSAGREGGFAQAYMPPPPPQQNMGPIQQPEPIQDARLGNRYGRNFG